MYIAWTVWADATSEKSARNVARRVLRAMDCNEIEPTFALYPKTGGWTFAFQIAPTSAAMTPHRRGRARLIAFTAQRLTCDGALSDR